jgi:type II secretory pathway component PulF
MLLSIAADERAALRFDDLASSLDAGLTVQALGGEAAAGERVVHGLLQRAGVKLSKTEDAVLIAAWRAGRIGPALRSRAEERRQRAQFARRIWAGLAYPLLLLVFVMFGSVLMSAVFGTRLLGIAVAALFVGVAVAIVLVTRGLRRGGEAWTRLPVIGRLAQDLGELPYLETLQSLYGAGVPLVQAHSTAVSTVPVASVQRRLQVAQRILAEGRPLAEALHQALALHAETRSLLASGERAGQLEDALLKALVRRREVSSRDITSAARWTGAIAYGTGILFAVIFIGYAMQPILKAYSMGR